MLQVLPGRRDLQKSPAFQKCRFFVCAFGPFRRRTGCTDPLCDRTLSHPADVWAEAAKRWGEIPAAEQQKQIDETTAARRQFAEMIAGTIKDEAFEESFNGFDLLWFGLAAFTAFRIAGSAGEE